MSTLIERVKTIYGPDCPYTNAEIAEYLSLATEEIISWEYRLVGIPSETPDTSEYDPIKVMAVIEGLTIHGAEGQSANVEGNFSRTFKYADMVDYIHLHVTPYVGAGR